MRFIIMLTVLLSLLGTEAHIAVAKVAGEQNLLVFYSNDVIGETEPCG